MFKQIALQKAAQAIRELKKELKKGENYTKIKGVGKGTTKIINKWFEEN